MKVPLGFRASPVLGIGFRAFRGCMGLVKALWGLWRVFQGS